MSPATIKKDETASLGRSRSPLRIDSLSMAGVSKGRDENDRKLETIGRARLVGLPPGPRPSSHPDRAYRLEAQLERTTKYAATLERRLDALENATRPDGDATPKATTAMANLQQEARKRSAEP